MQHVYLVPGFFGFANLGDLRYFGHVRDFLLEHLPARGETVQVHVVPTPPTASLPVRAAVLLETLATTLPDDGAPVHLIGHSSGGLDVRLLLAPGVDLPSPRPVDPYAGRVRTALTVATPHHGTPVAGFFASLLGQRLLRVLSLSTIYLLRFGHHPLGALLQLGAVLARVDGHFGLDSALLDEVFDGLLADFSADRRAAITAFFRDVGNDQGLLTQLTPESMALFAATTTLRPGVRGASIVAQARPPGIASTLAVGIDSAGQATHAVYQMLHRLARLRPDRVAPLTDPQADALRTAYDTLPDADANDGVVPTRSQPWADVIFAARADHLDVLGHFGDARREPPHVDWLTTGTGFDRRGFEALWTAAADFVLAKA